VIRTSPRSTLSPRIVRSGVAADWHFELARAPRCTHHAGRSFGVASIMSGEAFKLLVVLNASACLHRADVQGQRLRSKHQVTISNRPLRSVASASDATVRFRNSHGDLVLDDKAQLILQDHGRSFVASELLAKELLARAAESTVLFFHLEQAAGVLRAIAHFQT
jgi:hypothetical protein